MMRALQKRPVWQRRLIFFVGLGAIVAFFVFLTVFLLIQSLRNRNEALALVDAVQVAEFAALPDDDAYPAALALAADGTVYTGSYVSGVVWAIAPDGSISELPETRRRIGSVTGLATYDGALYVLDRIEPLSAEGATLWRFADNTLERLRVFDPTGDTGLLLPDDITLDAAGKLYITDRGPDRVWRYDNDGANGEIWWRSPQVAGATQYDPTGLAYDPAREAILISDPLLNEIYSVPVAADDPQAETTTLYRHTSDDPLPGFDGLTVSASGEIFVTALDVNRVARLQPASDDRPNGELEFLAGNFRGSSDVAYDAARQRLYVANWDQRWLLPVNILLINVFVPPRTPFAIDALTFAETPGE